MCLSKQCYFDLFIFLKKLKVDLQLMIYHESSFKTTVKNTKEKLNVYLVFRLILKKYKFNVFLEEKNSQTTVLNYMKKGS